MKLLRESSLFSVLVALAISFAPARTVGQQCGDVNGSGSVNIGDPVTILTFLHVFSPALLHPTQADIDTYQRVTTYDAVKLFDGILFTPRPFTLTCPGLNPPLNPPFDQNFRVVYGDTISAGASQAVIPVFLVSPVEIDWITLPLRIRLDGEIPIIDSVVFDQSLTGTNTSRIAEIRLDSGIVNPLAFAILRPLQASGVQHVMDIYVEALPGPALRTFDVSFERLKPLSDPAADTGVIPMVVEFTFASPPPHNPFTPTLMPDFRCGDVNHDYVIDSGDVMTLVDFYFNCGPGPQPPEAGDVNCDNLIDLSDLMLVTAAAAGEDSTLCCIQDLFPPQGDMPDFPPPTPAQDSLLVELRQALAEIGW